MTLIVMIAAALALTGVVFASAQDAAGRYDAVECRLDDEEYDCEGEYILLNADGSGEIAFNNGVYTIKWTLDGKKFSFTDQDDITCSGTLADGRIEAVCYDYQYIYELDEDSVAAAAAPADGEDKKEEADAESADAEAADKGDADAEDADAGDADAETADAVDVDAEDADAESGSPLEQLGMESMYSNMQSGPAVYDIVSRTSNGGSGKTEENEKLDYIALNEDGTGVFFFDYSAYAIRWKKDGNSFSFTDHLNNQFKGTMDESTISGDYGKYHYEFKLTDYVLPAYMLAPEKWGKGLDLVTDQADVLTDDQEAELTQTAQRLTDEYGVGVYVVLLDKRDDYTWTQDIEMLSEELRAGYALGEGPSEKKAAQNEHNNADWKDSVLLTVAFDCRKYDICTSGDYGTWAIPEYARESIRDTFLKDFENDNYANGVYHYMDGVERALKAAANGKPLSFKNDGMGRMIGIFVPILLALIFGYAIAAGMRGSMQNTSRATTAATYIDSDQVKFTRREDRYIRTIVTRVYSPKEKSSSGGSSSSGSGHTSGSF